MSHFAGKKVLCFLALPHHNRFLVPIMEALQSRGMEVVYFTVPAEGAFEITLNQANLPYRHIFDYADAVVAEKSEVGYREIRDTYQQKILANPVLQSVPVVIQDKVIRSAVENYNAMERMIEREKPDLLFALHEINPWGKMLGYLSHVHQVPFFTLQEGLYYSDLYYYRFHTDFSTACLVWGEDCRQVLLQAGCSDDKIFPVGNTHIWAAKKEFTDPARVQQTRESLGIAPGKKIVLCLMSHSEYGAFDGKSFLQWMNRRGDVVAVFKWHPVTSKAIVERAMKNLKDQPNVYSVFGIDTYALIGASDVCITVGNSTTGLEALAFDKPLLESRLPDQQYSFCAQGVAEAVGGFETFGPKCEEILNSGISKEWRCRIDRYLAHNFACRDNQTMGAILQLIDESLATRVRVQTPPAPLACDHDIAFPCSIILPVDDSGPEALLSTLAAVSQNIPAELFEIIVVDCSSSAVVKEILQNLDGDVNVIAGELEWSFGTACNRAAKQARGKYLAFLKPGLAPKEGWLEGLLEVTELDDEVAIVGGMTLNKNGLIDHIGVAFDVNQAPFSIYQFLAVGFFCRDQTA